MGFLDKFTIKTAAPRKIHFPLNSRHITTSDFFQLNVPYYRHMIPGQKLSVNVTSFARLAGMPVPTFGDANLNLRAFFVPYRQVFPSWDDFIVDTNHANASSTQSAIPPYVPRVTNAVLIDFLEQNSTVEIKPLDQAAPTTYDFSYVSSTDIHYLTLTVLGRYSYKILRSLGYNVVWDLNEGASYNALPLLCLLKVYIDCYYPAAYAGSNVSKRLESYLKKDNGSAFFVTGTILQDIMEEIIYVYYDNDYFTAAFDKPTGPNDANGASAYSINDVTSLSPANARLDTIQSTNIDSYKYANTPTIGNPSMVDSATGGISYYAIESLKRLTSFLTRNRLVGERAVDRFFARFGIPLEESKINRVKYLGSHKIPLIVGDVMSTADTSGAALGDYSGKGFLSGEPCSFEYEATEYGMFVVTSSIVPVIGYVEGMDYQVLKTTRLDFYQPEFDGLGTRPIVKAELYCPNKGGMFQFDSVPLTQSIFGFTPRYSEDKLPCSSDKLTGDFAIASKNASGMSSSAWNLFRLAPYTMATEMVHSRGFLVPSDKDNYDRIFYNTGSNINSADHFTIVHNFKVDSYSPVKPLYDAYEFEHEDGREVQMRPNGGNVN